MQHLRRIANATRIQGHIDDLLLHSRRLPCVGICEEKRTPALRARPAPVPLFALPRRAMSHKIRTLTMGAVQDWEHHDGTLSREGFSASHTLHRKEALTQH